jgi:hypothetical protein
MGPNVKATLALDPEKKGQEPVFQMMDFTKGRHLGRRGENGLKHTPLAAATSSLPSTAVTPWILLKWLFLLFMISAVAVAMWYSITLTGTNLPLPCYGLLGKAC